MKKQPEQRSHLIMIQETTPPTTLAHKKARKNKKKKKKKNHTQVISLEQVPVAYLVHTANFGSTAPEALPSPVRMWSGSCTN